MKKLLVFLLFCLILSPFFAFANADEAEDEEEEIKYEDPLRDAPRKPFGFQNRTFEMGISLNAAYANNYMSIPDFFKSTLILDLDELAKGFKMDLGIGVRPFYFKYDSKNGWGFGISTDVEAVGMLGLSGAMLSFDEAKNDKSDISGAVFASLGVDTFFQVKSFKVKFRPAMFYSVAYVKTDMDYSFVNSDNGTLMNIIYDMRIYTLFPLDDDAHEFKLNGTPGFDFSTGIVYPLSKEIGISSPFLDFDVGVDLINVPILSSTIRNYRRIRGSIGSGTPIDVFDEGGMGDFISSLDNDNVVTHGVDNYAIERPFKMLVNVEWRPFGKNAFTIIPIFGFSLNQLYRDHFSLEAGLNSRLNLANFFITTAGVNYTDRIWINSLDVALNLRVIEFNVGVDMRSQEFLKSWKANGIGVNVGVKFGW